MPSFNPRTGTWDDESEENRQFRELDAENSRRRREQAEAQQRAAEANARQQRQGQSPPGAPTLPYDQTRPIPPGAPGGDRRPLPGGGTQAPIQKQPNPGGLVGPTMAPGAQGQGGAQGPGGLGSRQQQVVANKDSYLQKARAKGIAQGDIDNFLKNNQNDYHRIEEVLGGGGRGAPAPASVSTPLAPPIAGLGGGAPMAGGGGAPGGLGSLGASMSMSMPESIQMPPTSPQLDLNPNLGRRLPRGATGALAQLYPRAY